MSREPKMNLRRWAALAPLAWLAACGGSPGDPGGGGGGGSGGSGGEGVGGLIAAGGSGGGLEGCAKSTIPAHLPALAVNVMFDRSGSMAEGTPPKWDQAASALSAFFQDPASDGMGVALRFFPDVGAEGQCNGAACDLQYCSNPEVDIALLTAEPAPADAHEQALLDAVAAKFPGGGTPTYGALGGALQWATTYAGAHADEAVAVVFVTDGEPDGCATEDPDLIAQLAADALASAKVHTFAIGIQSADAGLLALLDKIAAAGGTEKGILTGGALETELGAALQGVRSSDIACVFDLPQGDGTDPAFVNVQHLPTSGAPNVIKKAQDSVDPQSCNLAAWYFHPEDPTKIVLCPPACKLVQNDPGSSIEIVVGCETQIAE